MYDFNSMMVRLKVLLEPSMILSFPDFNSMMVRLKVMPAPADMPAKLGFQFHDGTIKSFSIRS